MKYPNENKTIIIEKTNISITLTPKDYMLDESINGANVLILKKEAIDKIALALNIKVKPYESNDTTILPNSIVYKNILMNSIVEHSFATGLIGDDNVVVEGIGEANPMTLTDNFMGYVGTMARKRAISNAVINFFKQYVLKLEPTNEILNEFSIYSSEEWQNKNNADNSTKEQSENPADFIFNGGKYSGKTIAQVYAESSQYLDYIIEKKSDIPSYAVIIDNIKKYLATVHS